MFNHSTKAIIVTDAGFRCPWFQQVREVGWDFVGRVRNTNEWGQVLMDPHNFRFYKHRKQSIRSCFFANLKSVIDIFIPRRFKYCHPMAMTRPVGPTQLIE